METPLSHWIGFLVLMVVALGSELWLFYKNPHPVKVKEALIHSALWILLALTFNVWIYFVYGSSTAIDFLTGYLVEKSLSIDNLFIFLLIFSHFKVPQDAKHPILFYGVLGAIVMRALFIGVGISLVHHFEWIFPVFGLFLIYTAFNLVKTQDEEVQIEKNWFYLKIKEYLRIGKQDEKNSFFVREGGKIMATPLFLVLLLIEGTDLIFALDSVPVIIGITTNLFIAFTSNILAILGLRALFFALEGVMNRFYLLHYALAFILFFIGFKMILGHYVHIPTWVALGVIVISMGAAIGLSYIYPKKKTN